MHPLGHQSLQRSNGYCRRISNPETHAAFLRWASGMAFHLGVNATLMNLSWKSVIMWAPSTSEQNTVHSLIYSSVKRKWMADMQPSIRWNAAMRLAIHYRTRLWGDRKNKAKVVALSTKLSMVVLSDQSIYRLVYRVSHVTGYQVTWLPGYHVTRLPETTRCCLTAT